MGGNKNPRQRPSVYTGAGSPLPQVWRKGLLGAIFLSYLLLWTVANWPALTTAWWTNDDYAALMRFDPAHNLQLGRPLEALHHWVLTWEAEATRSWLNLLLRYSQGILHCGTAFLAGWVLYCVTRRWHVWLYLLLFLLWPFHAEAVLWRASAISVGAALSMAGLVLITNSVGRKMVIQPIIGVLLVAASVLAHQLAAVIALVVWLIAVTMSKLPWTWHRYVAARLLLGYIAGGAVSLTLIRYFALNLGRATLTTDWPAKALLTAKLNGLLLIAPVYPIELRVGHLLLLTVAFALLAHSWILHRNWTHRLVTVGMLTLMVLPYAPLLLIAETLLAPRNLYLGTFLFIGATLTIDHLVGRRAKLFLLSGVLLLVTFGYLPLSRRNVSEFPLLYQQDLQTVATIEAAITTADQAGSQGQLVVATAPAYLRTWNPYGLDLMWGDAKKSPFLVEWAAPAFVEWQSSLHVVEMPEIRQWCVAQCQQQPNHPPFSLIRLEQGQWCLCP